MAYYGAGQKDAAIHAFSAVTKDNPNDAMIAHLWTIYVHGH